VTLIYLVVFLKYAFTTKVNLFSLYKEVQQHNGKYATKLLHEDKLI